MELKSLFNEYEGFTPEGETVRAEVEARLESIISNAYEQGYRLRDILSIVESTAGTMVAQRGLSRAIKMRKERIKMSEEEKIIWGIVGGRPKAFKVDRPCHLVSGEAGIDTQCQISSSGVMDHWFGWTVDDVDSHVIVVPMDEAIPTKLAALESYMQALQEQKAEIDTALKHIQILILEEEEKNA